MHMINKTKFYIFSLVGLLSLTLLFLWGRKLAPPIAKTQLAEPYTFMELSEGDVLSTNTQDINVLSSVQDPLVAGENELVKRKGIANNSYLILEPLLNIPFEHPIVYANNESDGSGGFLVISDLYETSIRFNWLQADGRVSDPIWSPNGKYIAFSFSKGGGPENLFLAEIQTGVAPQNSVVMK